MFTANWERWLSFFRNKKSPRTVEVRRQRPALEILEDRLVPSGTSTIAGFALNDLTGNGLSADDTGLSHVRINLYQDTNRDGKLDGRDTLVATQQTAANGSYSFDHLKAGTYFVTETTPAGDVLTTPTSGYYLTVALSANQSAGNKDFDNFKEPSTAALTHISYTIQDPTRGTYTVDNLRGETHQGDTVTVNFTVTGRSPVLVSLVVYSAPGASFDPSTASQQEIVADASQSFGPGRHSLTVQFPDSFYQVDFVAGAAIDHFGPAGSHIFYSAEQRLYSADNGGTQAVTPASLSGVAYNDLNQDGKLQSATENGLADVTVNLIGVNDLGQTVVMSMVTGADGSYQFTGLLPGTYGITYSEVTGFGLEASNEPLPSGAIATAGDISNIVLTQGLNLVLNLPQSNQAPSGPVS